MRRRFLATLALGLTLAGVAHGQPRPQVAHIDQSNGMFARAVTVPQGSDMIYVAGMAAQPADKSKPGELGDTQTQTASILSQIEAILKDQGYAMSDIVMMRVFLAGDPAKGGKMDFDGMNAAYNKVFGPLPMKPARATVQVAALARPTMLAEIEVQAARPKAERNGHKAKK